MTTVQFKSDAAPIGIEDITDLEGKLGTRLPDDYRRFMLANNGGIPEPNVLDIEGAPFGGALIQTMFSIGDPVESCDLYWNMHEFADRLEDPLLAIGCDGSGHTLFLVLDGDQRGAVYYFDFDVDPPKPYFIAKDFDSFVAKLRAFTAEEEASIEASLETAELVYSKDDDE